MPTGNARRRQWRLAVLVLAAACGPAAPPPTPTPPPAAPRQAQIAELANVVSARPAQTQAWQTAALGDVLGAGGGVLTGDASRARLDLSDGSILRLSANTEFQLLAFPPSAETPVTRLQVAAGQLWVIVTTLVTGASVEVETPTGLATVRGSLLSVEQAAGGGLQITCLEGECRLRNPASNAEVVLQPGQQSGQAGPGQDPAPPQPMTPAQYEAWRQNVPEAAAAVQRLLDQNTPTPSAPAGASLGGGAGGNDLAPNLGFDAQGRLHLVWESHSQRASGDYVARRRAADGAWSAPVALTSDFQFLYGSLTLRRAPSGALCALWNGARTGTADIGVYRTCLTGDVWPPAEQIGGGSVSARDYAFQYTAGGLRALYLTGAGTLNFTAAELATGAPTPAPLIVSDVDSVYRSALAGDAAGGLHAVWLQFGATGGAPSAIVHRSSSDGGQTWGPPETLTTAAAPTDTGALRVLADDAGGLHLLWSGASQLFYRRWTAGRWGAVEALPVPRSFNTNTQALALDPQGQPQAVWQDTEAVWLTTRSAAGGWSAPARVAATRLRTEATAFVIDAQGARHIAWLDDKAGDPTLTDLIYAQWP